MGREENALKEKGRENRVRTRTATLDQRASVDVKNASASDRRGVPSIILK